MYLEHDVFLLPTYYPSEAQPLTIIEALNAGCPVVATAHASIPNMVRDGVEGSLVPPRAPEAIADAVEVMRETGTWRSRSRAARARYVDRFSPQAVRRQWLDCLAQFNGGTR
jgi:glycosyltransferase involved in cell wall biosynthesis